MYNMECLERCVLFSRRVMPDSLQPHELQHTRLPCPSPTPRACSNSCPLSQWCHPTISSSVVPFSSCPQSFSASGSFPMRWLFASGGQSIGASASALLQEGGPLPGPKSGLLSNTWKWVVWGDTHADKARDFIGKGTQTENSRIREGKCIIMAWIKVVALEEVKSGQGLCTFSRWELAV